MRYCLALCLVFTLFTLGCGDDDSGGSSDAAANGDGDGGGGNGSDGGETPTADADPSAPDAPPATGAIACGTSTCDPATQECCVEFGNGGGATSTCVNQGDCGGTSVGCDGPEDCAGQGGADTCCFEGAGMNGGVACAQGNSCQIEVCQEPADCPTEQPMCCELGIFPTKVCAPQCAP